MATDTVTEKPRPRIVRLLRRLWPWLVGIAIVVALATRIPFETFRAEVGHGPHLLLATVDLIAVLIILATDSIATWIALVRLGMRRPLRSIVFVRGATYLLYVLNYALGQGGFGYYLRRSGETTLRAVGATLFLMGTNLATLLVITTIAYAIHPAGIADSTFGWTLVVCCSAFVVYLVVIATGPSFIARREVLAPLFDAGLSGHLIAMLGRLPHTAVIVLAQWVAIRAWGIEVPFDVAITIMPAIAIASVLPIAPAGLGTTQAALVFFFSGYATTANVFAFAIVHFVYGVLASVVVGLACTPFAKKVGALPSTTD